MARTRALTTGTKDAFWLARVGFALLPLFQRFNSTPRADRTPAFFAQLAKDAIDVLVANGGDLADIKQLIDLATPFLSGGGFNFGSLFGGADDEPTA